MPIKDIKNSPIAPTNGIKSYRRLKAYHSPIAISAVMMGTGERNPILGTTKPPLRDFGM